MDNEYLHKIDVKALLKELGITMQELADLAGYSRASNLNKWNEGKPSGGARPGYNTIVKLFEAGASVETLFGVEYKSMNVIEKQVKLTDQEILDGVLRAMAALNKKPQ